jgi:hypothetical protein
MLGLSGGEQQSSNQSSSNTQGSSSGTSASAKTFSPQQSGLQAQIGDVLSSMLTGAGNGTISPEIQSMETNSADQINQNYSAMGKNLSNYYASRGYGTSGVSGQTQLQNQLSRQGALASNSSNYAGMQLQQNDASLLAALNYAMDPMGTTGSTSTNSSSTTNTQGSSQGSNFGVSGSIPLMPAP